MYYLKHRLLSSCINIYLTGITGLHYKKTHAATQKSSPFFCQCGELVFLRQEKAEGPRSKSEEEPPKYSCPVQVAGHLSSLYCLWEERKSLRETETNFLV